MLDIQWGDPYAVKQGFTSKWRREWCIPNETLSGFFSFWKANRFKMLADGFTVTKSKLNGKWFLYETKNNVSLFHGFTPKATKCNTLLPNTSPHILSDYTLVKKDGLRPWQVGATEKLISSINKWGSAIDGSELGTGKTYSSCGVVRELDVPFIVVCPKPVIYQWNKVIDNHFGLNKSLGIINYELLIRGRKDSNIASFVLNRESRRKKFMWKLPKNSIIIWDEAHRLKNWKTKASKVCMEAYKKGYRQVFLSATLASSPLDLRTVGICTKMFRTASEYYQWAYDHGVFKGEWGLEFNNSPAALKLIHQYLFEERGVRLLRDVIPNFPETEIIVNAYDMDEEETNKIREIYNEMKQELALIKSKAKNDESEIAIRVRALQKTEMLKIPLIETMANEGIEAGMSVIVFLNFSDSIDALAKRFNTNCIYDGRNENIRQKYIELFQSNKEPLLIANLAAAREGLNLGDEYGGHPRLTLISPNDSVTKLKQVFGRVHRENSKTKSIQKLIYVAHTQEEDVVENFGQKLENLTLINNGIITDDDLKI
jgi:superfamily II DNA or RNA helicase